MADDPYEFVKQTGRDRFWLAQEKELPDFLDPETGELREDLARYVQCVICGDEKQNLVFKKEGFRYVKCCSCGMVFINPQLDQSRMVANYEKASSHETWVDVLLSPPQQKYDSQERFGEALRRLEKLYPKNNRGRVLDIGCSIGLFLNLARDRGWDPYGMEINRKAFKHATEVYGIPVDAKLLHEVNYPKEHYQISQ